MLNSKKTIIYSLTAVILTGIMIWWAYQRYRKTTVDLEMEKGPREILAKMSLEEKVGQLIHVGINGKYPDGIAERDILQYNSGGIILFSKNLGNECDIKKLNERLQAIALEGHKIPLFISIDQEGGRIARVEKLSSPGAMAIGQTKNENYAYLAGFISAHLLRNIGFNLILAPVLDVNSNPDNPVINTRSFGSSAKLVAEMGKAHSRGIRDAMTVPVIKHFPGHGNTETDSHLALPVIHKTLDEIQQNELIPFQLAIDDGAEALMSAHILFPAIDSVYPATLSKSILTDLLRNKMHYEGLIFTDAMEMKAVADRYSSGNAAKIAFNAGADVILLTSTGSIVKEVNDALLKGFQSGELSVQKLDESVLRQIKAKYRIGLFSSSGFKHGSKEISDYFYNREFDADVKYREILKKYNAVNESKIYRKIADDSIRSLRKNYKSDISNTVENIAVFYQSETVKKESLKNGIPANQVISLRNYSDQYNGKEKILAFQISDESLPFWNRLIESEKIKRSNRVMVALYTGNPFLKISIPEKGAVLVSFSPTAESLQALVSALLENQEIPAADLVLSRN